jgi:hypothetical protein
MRCATCGHGCSAETSRAYNLGPLTGQICAACEESLAPVITRWMSGRAREIRRAGNAATAAVRTMRLIESEALPKQARRSYVREHGSEAAE